MTTQKPIANAESQRIDDYLKRPVLYRNVDGTEEINMGIMGLGLAGMRFVYPLLEGSPLSGILKFAYLGVGLAIMHFGSKAIKKRLTYPRTGFAEPRCTNRGGKWLIMGATMLAAAVVSVVFALIAAGRLSAGPGLVGGAGMITAAVFANGIGKRVPWKLWVAAILAAGSLAIAVLPPSLLVSVCQGVSLPPKLSPALIGAIFLYLVWMGVVFLTSGLITLRQYVRTTQPAEPGAQ